MDNKGINNKKIETAKILIKAMLYAKADKVVNIKTAYKVNVAVEVLAAQISR